MQNWSAAEVERCRSSLQNLNAAEVDCRIGAAAELVVAKHAAHKENNAY